MITTTNITTTSNTEIYLSAGETGITTLLICNHSASDAVVNVFVVPDGDTAGNANQILKNLTIIASDTFVMDMEKLILSGGDSIV